MKRVGVEVGLDPAAGRVVLEAHRLDGEPLSRREVPVAVDAGESRAVGSVSIDDAIGDAPRDSVAFRVSYDGDGESYANFAFLEPFKRLDLPDPGLEVAVEDDGDGNEPAVVLETENAALFVALSARSLSGRFADNYFHVAPGERKRVSYAPRIDAGEPTPEELRDALEVTHLRETY